MANIKQVASLAGLSVACVSKYLKDSNSVRSSSKEKIEFAIKELDYVPSAVARNLRTKRTGIIKIITHSITNPFFAELFEMLRAEFEEAGYIVTLQSIRYMEYKKFSTRDFEQIDGVIFCFVENEDTLKTLEENLPKGLPAINMHGSKPISGINTIVTDLQKGAFEATKVLISEGCRNLAYIGANKESSISRLKLKGFEEAIQKSSTNMNYSLIQDYCFSMKAGWEAAVELYKKNPSIDAIFCENDLFAAGAIHYFSDQKIKIPEDIRIIGYDNIPLASMFIPSISSVSIPSSEICVSACSELISLIEKRSATDHYFIPNVILRQTTKNTRGYFSHWS